MSAREEILARVRTALADVPAAEPAEIATPAGYAVESGLSGAALVELFAERASDYRAVIRRADPGRAVAVVGEALAAHGATRIGVPRGLPAEWCPAGIDYVEDSPSLGASALDVLDGALTGCALAIAQTGTIVLDAGPDQGRRALTLVPDLHICVVLGAQIVGSVPEAIRALEQNARDGPRPLTLISGPSATSDIELIRVEGVHGPRRLEIIVVA